MNKRIIIYILSGLLVIGAWVYSLVSSKNMECPIIQEEDCGDVLIDYSRTFNCSFTRTYNIIDKLDNFETGIPEISYVVGNFFQDYKAIALSIPTSLKDGLEVNKSYEFTYTVNGTGVINSMDDVNEHLLLTLTGEDGYNTGDVNVTLTIKETDKVGLEQINENICE